MLGKSIYFDKISDPGNMACVSCHDPDYGFTGPNSGVNQDEAVYRGAVRKRFGNRKPPTAAYATFSPPLYFDEAEGVFIGGNFWDGRATGATLGSPAAEQALGPFLNPVEHNMSSKESVLKAIAGSKYASLWLEVFGEPIAFSTAAEVTNNYNRVGIAVAAYEGSEEVNQFTSKYDYYVAGEVELTEEELLGLELFNGKALCSQCHPSEGVHALFTDFTYDNIGAPRNMSNPFYMMDMVYLDNGDPINPEGINWIDPGLGGFLANSGVPAWQAMADENWGKHKVPTLRNVDKRGSTGATKAYLHNGVFKSLKEVVHFYNTRDVEYWDEPEVPYNVNEDELGNLMLTEEEEDALVAFMKTLSDGYYDAKGKLAK
jgi:cytochrome c peroxidase